MSGYMMVHTACVACSRVVGINPTHCPSLRVNGEREPICRVCFNEWNRVHRVARGLDPIPLHPQAYEPEPA